MSAKLAIEGLVAGYGQGDILRGVDLRLEAGTITCVIGPNGAGKSTILRAVSGLLRPSQGSITLGGASLAGLSPRRVLEAGVVHVPQERSLFPLMTVFENVLVGGHILRDGALARRRAEALVERFPLLGERRQAHAGSLSGGEQKIVEIARALMLEPTMILMDEPSMGLDPRARGLVFATITELNREQGYTVLLVEQNARAGLQVAHRAAVMDGGVVALEGEAASLLEDPRVAELYLGGRVHSAPTAPERPPQARSSAG